MKLIDPTAAHLIVIKLQVYNSIILQNSLYEYRYRIVDNDVNALSDSLECIELTMAIPQELPGLLGCPDYFQFFKKVSLICLPRVQMNAFDCFPFNKLSCGLLSSLTAAEKGVRMAWTDLINESVHTSDDIDIGDIDAVSRNFVVVKRGFVNLHYYYIPLTKVEGWDGNVLWLAIPEEKVVTKYEREDLPPDPSRYYVKDYPIYYPSYYPELVIIPRRFTMPSYSYAATATPTYDTDRQQPAAAEIRPAFICDLCSKSDFKSEDELANHVSAYH